MNLFSRHSLHRSCACLRATCLSALGLQLTVVARPAAAQSLPATLNLPPMPELQLSLPAPPTQYTWREQEGSTWLTSANAVVPRQWQAVTEDELRLELETGRLDLGRLSLTGHISTVPGRERDCQPDCRGAAWSSSLRLKYDAGDLGRLRETGPELNVGLVPARRGTKSQGIVRGGFSGKF
ncbi:MAG: hypothetical protein ABI895_41920 [Deltaproteobacteria bacterium]